MFALIQAKTFLGLCAGGYLELATAGNATVAPAATRITTNIANQTLHDIDARYKRHAKRPEILPDANGFLRIGKHHPVPVQVSDDSVANEYVEQLYKGILQLNFGNEVLPVKILEEAYPFQVTSTIAGLPFVSEALGLPLDMFLDLNIDPQCNAFLINAVVLDSNAGGFRQFPWRYDFAMSGHEDRSLSGYTEGAKMGGGEIESARTVIVLYLNDIIEGSELEVYNKTRSEWDCSEDDAADVDKSDQGSYHAGDCFFRDLIVYMSHLCGKPIRGQSTLFVDCQVAVMNAVLDTATLARVAPRKGRLVQFDGQLMHAIRLGGLVQHEVRVSLVLEQFAYPPAVVQKIETLHIQRHGVQVDMKSARLQKQFVAEDGSPRKHGSPGISSLKFQECILRLRENGDQLAGQWVRSCVVEARDSKEVDEL